MVQPNADLIKQLLAQGHTRAARDMAQHWVRQQPQGFEPLFMLASVHMRVNDYPSAEPLLERCRSLRPNDLGVIRALMWTFRKQAKSTEATELSERAIRELGELPELLLMKASLLDDQREYGEVMAVTNRLMEMAGLNGEVVHLRVRALHRLKRSDEASSLAQSFAENAEHPAAERRTLWLEMSKIADEAGRHEEAMLATHSAHALRPKTFHRQEYQGYVDLILSTFTASNMRTFARASTASDLSVFVVGMPRSGTTLVEQIIHAHPQGYGAGEIADIANMARGLTTQLGSMYVYPECVHDLTQEAAETLATEYLARLVERAGPNAQRVVNKSLDQFEHLGFISCVLPKSRILHVCRDPLDTCVSSYLRHLNMPYAGSFEHLGFVYRQHERLMDHWKAALDLPILTVRYEELVADQERITRQIIDFLGLPWDDRCLRYWETDRTVMTLSYDQVNRPMYDSSIGRWRNYEKHLGPLKKALGMQA